MSAPATTSRPLGGRRQSGPPLLAPALAYGALTIAAAAVLAGGPRPGTPAAAALLYARGHTGLLHAAALLIFGAAMPLAIWTATSYRRQRTLGVTAPGAVIGLTGGVLAAASLALSGLVTWTIADTAGVASPAVARVLFDLSFSFGAAGFVVPFSLLIAGLAVPSLVLGLTPKWLAWSGLVIAGIGVLSTLTLITPAMDPALPIGRFAGLAWIVAVSAVLPASRHQVRAARQVPAAA